MESHSIKKMRCPKCAELGRDTRSDNLHLYNDGHQYCFGCGYFKPSGEPKLRRAARPDAVTPAFDFEIPYDASPEISFKAYEWLTKECHFSFKDILNNNLLWSEKYQWLIFPIGTQDNIVGFQARNFDENKPYKWFTKFPKKDYLHVYKPDTSLTSSTLVVVEDIVSAIRVGNIVPCAALYGSLLSDSLILKIKSCEFVFLKIWLDHDKVEEAIKYSQRSKQLGLNSGLIITNKDPKMYPDSFIKSLVTILHE